MFSRRTFVTRAMVLGIAALATLQFGRWLACPPPITYQMPADGQLTLGLYNQNGALLRWLVQDDFRRAGSQEQSWDGADQWGRRVPPGDYVVRGIYHAPLRAKYVMTLCNPGTPPWPTADGRGDWLSDEANPQAAATDGEMVFLGSPGSEKGFSILALDPSGNRVWGANEPRHFHPRSLALAVDGDFLYALYSGPVRQNADATPYKGAGATGRAVLICLDKRTGEPARFSQAQMATWPYRETATWLWDLRNGQTFSPATYGGQPRYACLDVGEPTNAIGLAVVGKKIYVSLLLENKLIEINAVTGQSTGRDIPIAAPAGLCRLDDDTLLAISGRRVVKVRLEDGVVTPLINEGLSAPDSVTRDQRGQIFVSDWGNSFQVKIFDAGGHLLRAIGREGGRPWVGQWEQDGMLLPRGIAVTSAGQLWVAEDDGSPPRVSVWNVASGAFVRDYLGPAPYGGGTYFWFDPKDATLAHAEGVQFKIDYAQKTAVPLAIDYRHWNRDDPFTPNGHDLGPHPQVRILYHGGHEYAVVNMMPTLLSILQRQGPGYRAVAALGEAPGAPGDGTERMVWDSDVGHRKYDGYFPECFRGHAGDNFSWTDANGDNLVQPQEMHWVSTKMTIYQPQSRTQGRWGTAWGVDISRDWSFFFVEVFGDRLAVCRLDPKGWSPAGAPFYNMADAKPVLFEPRNHPIFGLHVTDDNKLIVSYNYETGNNPDAMAAYSLDGRKLWSVAMPKRATAKALEANNADYDFQIPALGDVVCAWLYHASFRPVFFTSDGLYVGTLLQDTSLQRFMQSLPIQTGDYEGSAFDDAATGPDALWSESAKYFYQAPEGALDLINGGNQQEHLLQIQGLESNAVGRFENSYRIP